MKQFKKTTSKELITKEDEQYNVIKRDINVGSIMEVAHKLFSEQALLTTDPDNVNVKDIELARAKSDSLLNSISNMLEISNKLELLKSDHLKFKREDELRILNSLRQQFEKAAEFSQKNITFCMERLEQVYEDIEDDGFDKEALEKLTSLQSHMEGSISTLKSISDGATKLLKAERETGGRSAGGGLSLGAINLSNFLDKDSDATKPGDSSSYNKKIKSTIRVVEDNDFD